MNFQRSLYASGLKPFYRVGKEGKFKRITGKVTWNVSKKQFEYFYNIEWIRWTSDTFRSLNVV